MREWQWHNKSGLDEREMEPRREREAKQIINGKRVWRKESRAGGREALSTESRKERLRRTARQNAVADTTADDVAKRERRGRSQ